MRAPLQAAHGGPDGGPAAAFDFSTNASPLGPPPALLRAVQAADRTSYPDPAYRALRRRLGDEDLVLPTAGGAEGIRRLTLAALLAGRREVWAPQPGFGDYALAAQALDLVVKTYAQPADIRPGAAALVWLCEPCNPTGASVSAWPELAGHLVIVDRAYEPLRLQGAAPALPPGAWQLVCPNKALGLTGIRAGYCIAPQADPIWSHALSLAPSWVLSAEGVAMLTHWLDADTQAWLAHARATLRTWAGTQRALLAGRGWLQQPSTTNFWLARPPRPDCALRLRERGLRVRDATSFGLPGWVRVSAQPPNAQQALQQALHEIESEDA
ncbi:MAG: aminotransferase class I/II-fold pyridoxal phosphate-dependent enzyme [Roseateles sp.]|uniref:aminotransferase class I/II-fold pyridoxal phosphate-dependent enzyme n=1 Tax=Roseateles sp. TaxID=1971397 RepID=UPI004036DB2D